MMNKRSQQSSRGLKLYMPMHVLMHSERSTLVFGYKYMFYVGICALALYNRFILFFFRIVVARKSRSYSTIHRLYFSEAHKILLPKSFSIILQLKE